MALEGTCTNRGLGTQMFLLNGVKWAGSMLKSIKRSGRNPCTFIVELVE